jgi:hypothetical protein
MAKKKAKKPKKAKRAPREKPPTIMAWVDAGINVAGRPGAVAALHGSGMTPEQSEAIVAAFEHWLGIAGAPVPNA